VPNAVAYGYLVLRKKRIGRQHQAH
jgi:hypothetical protein